MLEAYYEPGFSGRSHGFRPARGCHTALSEVVEVWKGTHWFIEGDISDCFGSLDHEIMIKILAEKIRDGRFLRLIGHMLKAGYLEDWRWRAPLHGPPPGGIATPLPSHIYPGRAHHTPVHADVTPGTHPRPPPRPPPGSVVGGH